MGKTSCGFTHVSQPARTTQRIGERYLVLTSPLSLYFVVVKYATFRPSTSTIYGMAKQCLADLFGKIKGLDIPNVQQTSR